MLIGERPGLSAADSLGAYLTCAPTSGTPDSKRNCISNIRDGGLAVDSAADAVVSLVMDMLTTGTSGIGLKDAVIKLASAPATAIAPT
jgi:ethanolamine ammonia-lyase small subunit